ncbi:MAG TPA: FliM/FliN family flagellar motor switch protein, partial [bacterium]|nr:FliM/FliN family flagellar motor switch protein [bacterium]
FITLPMGGVIPDRIINPDAAEPPETFSELHKSALVEITGQLWAEISESFYKESGVKISAGASTAVLDSLGGHLKNLPAMTGIDGALAVSYSMEIPGVAAGAMLQLFPIRFVKELFTDFGGEAREAPAPAKGRPRVKSQDTLSVLEIPKVSPLQSGVKRAAKTSPAKASSAGGLKRNLEVLLDIPVEVTVEIGRKKVPAQRLMNMGPGAIIELDSEHKKPIRVLVNEHLVALGEVVAIGETFGVRIVELVEPKKRLEEI